jgi:DNA-binding response OmpR family regulator
MASEGNSDVTVLVVDDDEKMADSVALTLESEYEVETAYTGPEGLETVDDGTDVVLLDRRMPEMSGDEVLEEIQNRGYDCRVAMVTAVDPDFDILDMGFDDYVVKPIEYDELFGLVDRLVAIDEYEDIYQEYSSLKVKREVLQTEKSMHQLDSNAQYQETVERIAELEARLEDIETTYDIQRDRYI